MAATSSSAGSRGWGFGVLLVDFALFGIAAVVLGATAPRVMRDLGWSYVATGSVMSASSVGYLTSTFLAGLLTGRTGPRPPLLAGLGLQAVGLALFGRWPGVAVNMGLTFSMGVGHGFVEVATNVCVLRMERARESRLMNLMHAAFPVGAILGPLIVAWLFSRDQSWQILYRWLAGACGAVALLVLARPFAAQGAGVASPLAAGGALGMLRSPTLLLYAAAITFYVACEVGVSSWVAEFFVAVHGCSAAVSARMVALFWAGILLGRLGASFGDRLLRRLCGTHEALLLAFTLLQTAALFAAVWTADAALAAAAFFFCGLGCSAVYPLAMTLVGRAFPQRVGAAVGVVASGGGLGAMLAPVAISWLGARLGMVRGFSLCLLLSALTLAAAAAAAWPRRRGAAA